jgi:hypothetical protein
MKTLKIIEKRKSLVKEARYLLQEAKLSYLQVSNRLGISVALLKRIVTENLSHDDPTFHYRKKTVRFQKLHERAKGRINEHLQKA